MKVCADCRGTRAPGRARCDVCLRKRREAGRARQKIRESYVPIDEKLRRPRSMLLRTLRRFDWVESVDLFDACDVPPWQDDPKARNAYSSALSTLVRDGCVERREQQHPMLRGGSKRLVDFRITAKGREEAARLGRVDMTNVVAA